MKPNSYYEHFDLEEELQELDLAPVIRNLDGSSPGGRKTHRQGDRPPAQRKTEKEPSPIDIALQHDSREDFNFTYKAARHEQGWLLDSLGNFYDSQWIKDVLRMVKGGKEASVYLCLTAGARQAHGRYMAAKVYRPRMLRNLRKDHLYREGRSDLDIEGRQILDDGMHHAMYKHTNYGQELLHTSWIGHEFKTMQNLHAAGADVPAPLASGNNAILMEYIGDLDLPAPTLNTIELEPGEARQIFERVIWNIDLLLAHRRVHGDLSAFNILYWDGEITLIDFPQAIDPQENRNAFRIFERDVQRVCEYFQQQKVKCEPRRLAADLWTAHGFSKAPEVHPLLLDEQDERDRQYWNNRMDQ